MKKNIYIHIPNILALEIIQEDYRTESKAIEKQLSIQLYPDYNIDSENYSNNMKGEPQQPNRGLDTSNDGK